MIRSEAAPAADQRPLRLLVVEDHRADVELMVAVLKRAGYPVAYVAVDSRAGLEECLREGGYDVILCDHNLQTWRGTDALDLVKASGRDIPFVLVTATLGDEAAVSYIKQGAAEFVLKHHLERLPVAVGQVLREKAQREETARLQETILYAKREWELTFDSLADPVFLIDGNGIISRANWACTELLNVGFGELVGKSWHDVLSRFGAPSEHCPHCRFLQKTGDGQCDMTLAELGKSLHVKCRPLRDPGSVLPAWVLVLHDITERRKAQETLARSEEQYRRLFDSANDAILIFEPTGEVIRAANAAACKVYGFGRDELVGMSVKDLTKDVRAGEAQIQELLGKGSCTGFESVHFNKQGEEISFLINSSVIEYQGQRAILSLNRDVTEHKRAEASLAEREACLRERLKEVNCLYQVSQTARREDLSEEEALQRIVELIPAAFRYPEIASARILLHGREYKTADWQESPWALSSPLVLDSDCTPRVEVFYREERPGGHDGPFLPEECDLLKGIATLVESMVKRRRAEAALRASETRYHSLFDNAPVSLWEEDFSAVQDYLDGLRAQGVTDFQRYFAEHFQAVSHCVDLVKVLDINQASLRIFQASDKPTLLTKLKEVFTEDSFSAFQELLAALAAGSTSFQHETIRRTLADQRRHLVIHWHVAPGHEQRLDRLLVSVLDITEARKLEEQLRQAQRMEAVGQLAGGVAHDFNNVLMVIKGYSELLTEQLSEQAKLQAMAKRIQDASDRAASLVAQLLAFSRKQVLQPRVLDLNTVVANMHEMLRRLIGEDIDLVSRLCPELGKVRADPAQLEQIVMNLAINARDAMPQGGTLTLETSEVVFDDEYARKHLGAPQPGPYVMLAVTDTGTGMDRETLAHIFEPFFTTKEKGKGTGLGLATVYGIVKQSDGFIWTYSEPGHGSTFKVYLPCVAPAAEPAAQPAAVGKTSGAWKEETVLVVEDEESMRHLVGECLKAVGCQVLFARDGAEALRVAGEHRGAIHLLLTDVVMPKLGGPDLAHRLKAQRPDMKVVFMSGYTDSRTAQRAVLETRASFLQKPIAPRELVHKLRGVLDSEPDSFVGAETWLASVV